MHRLLVPFLIWVGATAWAAAPVVVTPESPYEQSFAFNGSLSFDYKLITDGVTSGSWDLFLVQDQPLSPQGSLLNPLFRLSFNTDTGWTRVRLPRNYPLNMIYGTKTLRFQVNDLGPATHPRIILRRFDTGNGPSTALEPSALLLLGIGLSCLALARRKFLA